MRAPRPRTWLAPVAIAWLLAATAEGAEPSPTPTPTAAVLRLADGGYLPGALADSGDAWTLRWKSPMFAAPLDFLADQVNAIEFPAPGDAPKPTGEYAFELAGGDVLFGALIGLGEDEAELDVPGQGRLKVKRGAIARIYRWRDGADLIHLGPNGLAGWVASPEGDWRVESGRPATDRAGASLFGDFALPARAAIEIELSWKDKPDFVLALGVGPDGAPDRRAFRFEVWDGELVADRETEREADVASLQPAGQGAGRAHLLAYLDQERGRLLVDSTDGHRLADLEVARPESKPGPGLRLTNRRGDVRLDRLRIGRWDGAPPFEARADRSCILRDDGSTVAGRVVRLDGDANEFIVQDEGRESRIARDRVVSLFLAPTEDDFRALRAVARDGTRASGGLVKVEGGSVWIKTPGVSAPLKFPSADLRALVVLHHEEMPPIKMETMGTLEMEGVRLIGRLMDARERPGETCLAWQPRHCANASPIRPDASGRIVYREPPPPQPPAPRQPTPPQPRGALLLGVMQTLAGSPPPSMSSSGGRRALHLRTGDVIPCEVTKIDEKGVTFRSTVSDRTFVPNDKVKAVELASSEPAVEVRLTRSKRDRLLTLPRLQKANPPTHLIRSRNGDYLRARVVGMDEKALRAEIHLETKEIPRDRVARILWLHADETDPPKEPADAPGAPSVAFRVQALRHDGVRMTFAPDRFEDQALSGRSDVLGACRVPLKDVDVIYFGAAIEQAASKLAYQQWKLHHAEEPKDVGGDASEARMQGTESAMVGKPAPDFTLELLGGSKFRLADAKGKVVVLDFWATWCGPCLQAMPMVERVVGEFQDRGVQLVAVNLQEEPAQITALLDRQKLHPTVALDRDGVVADRYGATAIPQTVIVARDGTVARLFVGGGPRFEDQFREALKAVVADDK